MASWTKNSELVLEAFPDYWRGEPAIKRIVFRPIPDETVRLTNLRSGTVKLVDGVPPQALSQVASTPGIKLRHHMTPAQPRGAEGERHEEDPARR